MNIFSFLLYCFNSNCFISLFIIIINVIIPKTQIFVKTESYLFNNFNEYFLYK